MSLNLIKLCVGCESVDELKGWIRDRLRDKKARGLPREHVHTTRMSPKRCAELLDGGSLYWVIRGELCCRQALKDLRAVRGRDGVQRCELVLEPKVVLVQPRPYRAFQGWRYLAAADAPADLDTAARGARLMPEPLRRELRELGLL